MELQPSPNQLSTEFDETSRQQSLAASLLALAASSPSSARRPRAAQAESIEKGS